MRKNLSICLLAFVVVIALVGCYRNSTNVSDFNLEEDKVLKNIKINDELKIIEIKEGAYIVEHSFPWPANSLIVEMNNSDIVLVDTPYTPKATEELLEWIDKEFGKRKVLAINTHFHVDNLGGNQALKDRDIPIYGSKLTAKLLKIKGKEFRELVLSWLKSPKNKKYYEVHAKMPYVEPTHLFNLKEETKLTLGDETIEIYYPGETHAPDNLAVYFPSKNILFGSCMVQSLKSKKLGNISDANLKDWPKSLEKLLNKYKDAEIVVPGHGKWGKVNLITHTIDLLNRR